jgi:hypothetical protein
MTPGRAQRFERAVILSLFPAFAWVSVAVFALAISWDGFPRILAVGFWLGAAVGAMAGLAARVLQAWMRRHRAGAVTAMWWLTAGPIVLLGLLSIVSPWTYVALFVLLACGVFGLVLGLPSGLAVASLVRLLARPRRRRARWPHE